MTYDVAINKRFGGDMSAEATNTILAYSAIFAALCGPIAAVVVTLVWEQVRRSREQRLTLLQTLLATRGRYADPSYSWAIRTLPLAFARNAKVMSSHEAFLNAAREQMTDENRELLSRETARREGIMISEILKDLGYRGFTSEQIEAYTAGALADREVIIEQALKSLPYLSFQAKRSADAAEAMVAMLNSAERSK